MSNELGSNTMKIKLLIPLLLLSLSGCATYHKEGMTSDQAYQQRRECSLQALEASRNKPGMSGWGLATGGALLSGSIFEAEKLETPNFELRVSNLPR